MTNDLPVNSETEDAREFRRLAERLRDFAAIGPHWFWECDAELRYTFVSEGVTDVLGIPPQAMLGRRRGELARGRFAAGSTEVIDRHVDDLVNRRAFRDYHFAAVRPDGSRVHILSSGYPFFGSDGEFLGYRGVSTDFSQTATAEAKVRESEQRLRAAIEAIEDGFIYFDADERFVLCNSKYFEFYADSSSVLIPGAKFEDIVRNGAARGYIRRSDPELEKDVAERMRRFREASGTFEQQLGNGRWLRVEDRRTADGGTVGFRVDITDLKRRELDLSRAREEADAASHAKTEFLASMSHELRTPMNAILGFGQLIEQTVGTLKRDRIGEYAHYIVKSGQHLINLINQVLELSKIESGHILLNIDSETVAPLVRECLEMVRGQADERGIDLIDKTGELDLPAIRTDGSRFRQVLLNLLSNAVKYNRAGGSVVVSAGRSGDHFVRVSVADTGEGIASERQANVFQPFDRLGREGGAIEGTGIGLYLTQRMVEQLDGAIGFESTPGVGSAFWVEMPISGNAPREAPRSGSSTVRAGAEPAPFGRYAVLYIEDNLMNQQLMEEIFESRLPSIDLVVSLSAEEGVDLARQERPDLIIMDINLPGMSGFEALKHLSSNAATARIPVIALSAAAAPDDISQALAAGFADYLTKPVDLSQVVAAIERQLGIG